MKLGWFVTGLAGCVLAVSCSSDPEPRTKLRVGVNPWAGWTAIDVANAKGFWTDQNLDVEVVHLETDQEMATALAQDRIDVAIGMIGTWVGYSSQPETPPVTIIAETDWSYGGDQIIAKKTLDTTKLKGKTVAVYLDQPSVTIFLQQYLSELNPPLKLKDVNLVELEAKSIADEFTKGTYDLTINYEPDSLAQLDGVANGVKVATSRSYPGIIPEGFAMKTDVIGKRVSRDTVRRCLAGWLTAVDWIYGKNGDGQTPNPATWEEYKSILRNVSFATSDGPATYTDKELDGVIFGVHVHGRALFNEINGPARNQKLTKFAEADATIAQPQPQGQPLVDFFTEMEQFMAENGAPIDRAKLAIDTSIAAEASK